MSDAAVLREGGEDGVLLLTLNRPHKKNAFDDAQWLGLRDARREAGGDRPAGIESTPFHLCIDALVDFDKPLLAAATGVGVGIGATFLFHCDVVYVGESVRLRLPFVSLGLVPEAASSYVLAQAIGSQPAAELFYTAEWIDARRAVEVGIAARAYPDGELLDAALAKAREIARWPVASLQATKRCLKLAHEAGIRAARAAEDAGMAERAGSPENVEAVTAFLQKREPDFSRFRRRPEGKR